MTKGYALFAANHWYIMPTEKRKITKYIMADFLRTVAEERGKSKEQVREVLANRQATAELRKLIEPCRFSTELDENDEPIIRMEVGKPERPHTMGAWKSEEVTVFTELTERRVKEFWEE